MLAGALSNHRMAALKTNLQLWLFLVSGLLAFLLGFVLVRGNSAVLAVSFGGYWFVFCAVGLWLHSLWESHRNDLRFDSIKKVDPWIATAVLLGSVVLLVHEEKAFKILMDEIMLLSTSMSMHFDRTSVSVVRAHDLAGSFVFTEGMIDKRPLLHPFLLSVLHDLLGYRPANAFLLSGGLGVVFLSLVGWIGKLYAGRAGGILCITLFTGLPMIAQNACGGGFELLNLVMLSATYLTALVWLERRDGASLAAMCLSAVLLLQVRYESVLLALPVVPLVLWVWWQEKRVILDWRVIVAPLLLVSYALHYQVFKLAPDHWQMASKPGYDKPFSLSYVGENLLSAGRFYFGLPSAHPSSVLFSGLGIAAIVVSTVLCFTWLRRLRTLSKLQIAGLCFLVGMALHFLLMMAYFWGKFDDPVIRRLSLPSHVWFALALLVCLSASRHVVRATWALAAVSVVFLVSVSMPAIARHLHSDIYTPSRDTQWRMEYVKANPERDYLVIDKDSFIWVTQKVSATSVAAALQRKEALQFHMRCRSYSNILAYQHFAIDEKTGKQTVIPDDDLGVDFDLETIWERRLSECKLVRLQRVVAVRVGGVEQRAGEPFVKALPTAESAQPNYQMRREHLDEMIRNLP